MSNPPLLPPRPRPSVTKHTSRSGHLARFLILALAPVLFPSVVSAKATPVTSSGGAITVAGSATLGPVLEAAGKAFAAKNPDTIVDVELSSSGAGIERFCAGEVDLATSGRTMRDEEAAACEEAGIQYHEFEVAFDGVAVVIHSENTALTCVTVDQLMAMWEPDSTIATWADVEASWPDEPLTLYDMGEESGTYQFFTHVVVGEEGVSRDDYNLTEGHPETAEGVANDPQALGFLPFPRYLENQDRLSLLEVDSGDGCVAPSAETIQDGSYTPLSRPMYVYVNAEGLARPEMRAFMEFWFSDAAPIAESGGLVPSNDSVYAANLEALMNALDETGTPSASPGANSRSRYLPA